MRRRFPLLWCVFFIACLAIAAPCAADTLAANDNRTPAGTLHDGVLTLHLRITDGEWQAEDALPAWRMLAFAEGAGAPTTPGPLLRVAVGTRIEVDVRNETGDDVVVHGLHARSAADTPLRVPANGAASARFVADTAGTWFYWGTLGKPLEEREGRDSELTGALIVDAPGVPVEDRVFIISRHGAADEGGDGVGAWAINGRSWPQTERLAYRVGETVHWRWINATGHRHPMHLHGNFFRVTNLGDNGRERRIERGDQEEVVTQSMRGGSTMAIEWTPLHAGNWLFHCHIVFHVMPDNRLPVPLWYDEYALLPHDQHMAGLVLGIHVAAEVARGRPRLRAPQKIALRAAERSAPGLDAFFGKPVPLLGYSVDGSRVSAPGQMLVVERGRPVEVAIHNDLHHATSVHWHGIELENSYYDGVPHWGVDGGRTTPWIDPRGDFVARFTVPRAGTYIYHTHFNDFAQLTAGLYGALIVLDPGHRFDAALDHVFVLGQGPDDMHDPILVNGVVGVPAARWQSGREHRIRLVGITAVATARVALSRDGRPAQWRLLAKDGADVPPSLSAAQTASVDISPGETYDFAYAADEPAALQLAAGIAGSSEPPTIAPIDVVEE